MGDTSKGLYQKFIVARADGQSEPGQKHDVCEYFVLDITHDPHAIPALEAYALSCQDDYRQLAYDLMRIVRRYRAGEVSQ